MTNLRAFVMQICIIFLSHILPIIYGIKPEAKIYHIINQNPYHVYNNKQKHLFLPQKQVAEGISFC